MTFDRRSVPHKCRKSLHVQVDIHKPDLAKFPRFQSARGFVVHLQPGEMLFVPRYWWHEMASPWTDTVSINYV